MEENKTSRKKTLSEKKEISKTRSKKEIQKKISPAIPLAIVAGVLLATLGGPWIAVTAAFMLGIASGFLICNWVWIGRQHK